MQAMLYQIAFRSESTYTTLLTSNELMTIYNKALENPFLLQNDIAYHLDDEGADEPISIHQSSVHARNGDRHGYNLFA